ncbi:hypothetical protein PG994_005087 [Apiospora phragmitis]|uniref:Uncharacterized protein n=1 Tax=Apiospora phragmitis TaxID=2905665 RepID=A0ABR1VSF4_9PEZI
MEYQHADHLAGQQEGKHGLAPFGTSFEGFLFGPEGDESSPLAKKKIKSEEGNKAVVTDKA